ncbi:ATP-binding domain-containing protein [Acinetobacter baumannii]
MDPASTHPADPSVSDSEERSELERRRLFVAMTRARDRLWLGTVLGTKTAGTTQAV